MDCWVLTGKLLDWPSTALSSSLVLLSSLLLVQGLIIFFPSQFWSYLFIFNYWFCFIWSIISVSLVVICSNIYYINDNLDKRTWTYIFGACCATTVFIPSFHNYRLWSFLGLGMTTYTAWYLTIAAFVHGQVILFDGSDASWVPSLLISR